jgi:spore coat polysaccharide biosynthesis protein SpsF (cytidylyltransferase family)
MIGAIIQARYGSSRLPGKVLEDLAGRTVLSHVIERCRATRGVDVVCCAVPDTSDSDGVAAEAERLGAIVVRGSEADVLGRFALAARTIGTDIIMRVTSDCPLSDPRINAQVLELLVSRKADYACNNMLPAWPHGLDCEIFTRDSLERAMQQAKDPYEREHVTPWLREQPGIARAVLPGPGGKIQAMRWTLDYPEDLEFFRAVFAHLPPGAITPGYETILALLKKHPEIAALNAHKGEQNRALASTEKASLHND